MGDLILKLRPLQGKDLNDSAVYDLCETHAGQSIEVQFERPGTLRTIKPRRQLLNKQFVYSPTLMPSLTIKRRVPQRTE